MIQKIIKVGNSYAVTIPKWFIDELQLKVGDKVHLTLDEKRRRIILDFSKEDKKTAGERPQRIS